MMDINWTDFHFLRPHVLWLLVPALLLLARWIKRRSRQDGWQQNCDPELLQAMQVNTASQGTRWTGLYWPIVIIALLALAGPAVRQLPMPVIKNQSALVVALDVSKSMWSDDLKPSRLQRAKFAIQDLLAERKDGQTALIVYSGDAFVVTPLTDDAETIIAMLDVVDPSIMPVTGTNTVSALDKAESLLQQAGSHNGQILLITDSINLFKAETRLREVAATGTTINVLAVGTAEGAPIPTSQGFLKDLRGQIVIPKVDHNSLQQAAAIGNGRYDVLNNQTLGALTYEPEVDDDAGLSQDDAMGSQTFIDDGPLLALLIIPLLALLYRRGILMVLCLGFMLNPDHALALSWDDLWLNPDQQAYQQLENSPDQAYLQAEDQRLKAAAAYKNKEFKAAADLLKNNRNSLADHYNHGNAQAQQGDLKGALDSYEKALEFDPEDADTLYNKQLVEQALQQQEQQNQQDQENQDSEENQDQNADQSQDSEQQSGENQESQDQQESDSDQQQQAEQDQQQEAEENSEESGEEGEEQNAEQADQEGEESEPQEIQLTPEEMALDAEEKQAMEQWLRRIKDDPGGLLRRKFLYQYHRRNQEGETYDNQTTEDW